MGHNYPKQRKSRDVGYAKSFQLLQEIGEDKLRELFSKAGIYKVTKQVSEMLGEKISPNVVYYCRKRYNLGGKNEKTGD